jgi:hypothetical protein
MPNFENTTGLATFSPKTRQIHLPAMDACLLHSNYDISFIREKVIDFFMSFDYIYHINVRGDTQELMSVTTILCFSD